MTVMVSIRVPEKLLKQFDQACDENYTTKSEVIRQAMLKYIQEKSPTTK